MNEEQSEAIEEVVEEDGPPGEMMTQDSLPSFRTILLKASATIKKEYPDLEAEALTNAAWEAFDVAVFEIIQTEAAKARRWEARRHVHRISKLATALRASLVSHRKDCPEGQVPPVGACLCGARTHNTRILEAMRD